MTTQRERSSKPAPRQFITTNTGRILTVTPEMLAEAGGSQEAVTKPAAAAPAKPPVDPARRPDVLLRRRREEGQELSSWWMVGAFLGTSALVIVLLSGVPYFA